MNSYLTFETRDDHVSDEQHAFQYCSILLTQGRCAACFSSQRYKTNLILMDATSMLRWPRLHDVFNSE